MTGSARRRRALALREEDALAAAKAAKDKVESRPAVDTATPALPGVTEGPPPIEDAPRGAAALVSHTVTRLVPKDALGFPEGATLSLTREQFKWLAERLDAELDKDADEATGVDPTKRVMWFKNPDFVALYDTCVDNKREAARLLGSQLLPKALRTIYELLDGDSVKGKQVGLTMLLRMQGLLIDKVQTTSPDAIQQLMEALREHSAPEIARPEPR